MQNERFINLTKELSTQNISQTFMARISDMINVVSWIYLNRLILKLWLETYIRCFDLLNY